MPVFDIVAAIKLLRDQIEAATAGVEYEVREAEPSDIHIAEALAFRRALKHFYFLLTGEAYRK